MKTRCIVDPLISSNLSALVEVNETRLLIEQKTIGFHMFKNNIKDFSKKELLSFKKIILQAYDREKGKNYFLESALYIIEQQFRKL